MKTKYVKKYEEELNNLCLKVKELISEGDYSMCEKLLCEAMFKYPHAPHPHNLFGIVLQKQGDHYSAMNHFRAAWALDPSYSPANHNLNVYGTFFQEGICAYDESDVPVEKEYVSLRVY